MALVNGKMEVFEASRIKWVKSAKKIGWGSVVSRDFWVSVAGRETHLTKYFDDNSLWGFLDANPGHFSPVQILEFYNNASLNEAGSWITSSVGGTEVCFNRRKFGKIFSLDYNFLLEEPTRIGE